MEKLEKADVTEKAYHELDTAAEGGEAILTPDPYWHDLDIRRSSIDFACRSRDVGQSNSELIANAQKIYEFLSAAPKVL